ncbi:erythromycin esterase family protein [Streptomyces toxytricini]|uniref:Erythromycin esterase family protein n=1 Tax=Streptomyces toxytricini TaxID=67369 RepID=A0ABW8EID0_STRT5
MMSQEIREIVPASCGLLGLGEPTHLEPAFGWVRNDLFGQLAGLGFRSVALEIDRVAALAVDDYVRKGRGTLDAVMREGFSHGWGESAANRRLVAWMHAYNRSRPPQERLAFHGFDAPTESMSAPSPRPYLEHARAHLGLDLGADLAELAGDDARWSRPEAVLDAAASPGAEPATTALLALADDLWGALYARAPERIAATSREEWHRAGVHLAAGRGLLRYHRQAARPMDQPERVRGLLAVRDGLMAENLLAIRAAEAGRGPTLVCAHNLHLQRQPSSMRLGDADLTWSGAGAVVGALLGAEYAFVAGSLGRSAAIGLGEPEPDTYEGLLQRRAEGSGWGLTAAPGAGSARTRTDTVPQQGYFPLGAAVLAGAAAVLHIPDGPRTTAGHPADAATAAG